MHGESLHCEWGLVSRDGWSVVDDSDNWGLTEGAEWWDTRNTDDSDWYLFAHGLDFKKAIADYMLVGGKVPVIPRYSLGVWFTRWYDFNNMGVKRLVNKYVEKALPLDVYVTNSPPSTSFFANSRTLMGCTDPLRRGVGAPHQCPLESVACHFMLTCGCTFR